MPKYPHLVQMLEGRIRKGDYAITGLPTEKAFAAEVGVSRMTARRVMLELVEKGLLQRKPHGKLGVNPEYGQLAKQLRLAFLGPSFSSRTIDNWRHALSFAASQCNATVRSVDYVHWNDPVIPQTLERFDGVFMAMSSEEVPEAVLERMGAARNLVVLDRDMTAQGLPSIELLPPTVVGVLGNHLVELGHKKIACINTQPHDHTMKRRLEQWLFWTRVQKVEGFLYDEPVKPFMQTLPAAYEMVKRLLAEGTLTATGLICLTETAAIGAVRACHEAGLSIGSDVSVCVIDGGGQARYYVPSLTSVYLADPVPYLEVAITWMSEGRAKGEGVKWQGPLLVQPPVARVFAGESTGVVVR